MVILLWSGDGGHLADDKGSQLDVINDKHHLAVVKGRWSANKYHIAVVSGRWLSCCGQGMVVT